MKLLPEPGRNNEGAAGSIPGEAIQNPIMNFVSLFCGESGHSCAAFLPHNSMQINREKAEIIYPVNPFPGLCYIYLIKIISHGKTNVCHSFYGKTW
jgi:hypothetical protein